MIDRLTQIGRVECELTSINILYFCLGLHLLFVHNQANSIAASDICVLLPRTWNSSVFSACTLILDEVALYSRDQYTKPSGRTTIMIRRFYGVLTTVSCQRNYPSYISIPPWRQRVWCVMNANEWAKNTGLINYCGKSSYSSTAVPRKDN